MTPNRPRPHPIATVGAVLGAAGGYALGHYAWAQMIVPMGSALAFGFLAAKLVGPGRKPMVAAFAVQAGHFTWMLVGAAMLGAYDGVLLDLIVLAVGLTWLMARPGLVPVGLLSTYQAVGLVLAVPALMAAAPRTMEHKALVVHITLRVLAVVLMVQGLWTLKKPERPEPPDPAPDDLH